MRIAFTGACLLTLLALPADTPSAPAGDALVTPPVAAAAANGTPVAAPLPIAVSASASEPEPDAMHSPGDDQPLAASAVAEPAIEPKPAAADKSAWEVDVMHKARELAGKPYDDPMGTIPAFLASLTGPQWDGIGFRPDHTLWKDDSTRFAVSLMHPGFIYNRTVGINLVENGVSTPLAFSPDLFNYQDANLATQMKNASPALSGYAGFTLRFPLGPSVPGRPDILNRLAVFLGASQFQSRGRNSRFGVNARAVTLDTALPDGEEYPHFSEFWLVKPAAGVEEITVYALLDSPSLTGAYRFIISPGLSTVMDVEGKLFPRPGAKARKIGLAPIGSMFLFSETRCGGPGDYRPEVHNSDGLLYREGENAWTWSPLWNPERLSILSFPMSNPRGFGLMQRDANFDHYQDLANRFDRRASVWVEPKGDWGAGRIELVEIPGGEDYQGNIVAYWVGDGKAADAGAGQPPANATKTGRPDVPDFAYRVYWMDPGATPHEFGRVTATRLARPPNADNLQVFIDFEGEALNDLPADTGLSSAVEIPDQVQQLEKTLMKNPVTGGWRLGLKLRLPKKGVVESLIPIQNAGTRLRLKALLKRGENLPDALTEAWVFDLAQ